MEFILLGIEELTTKMIPYMKLLFRIELSIINCKAFISHTIVHNKFYVLNWFYLHIILLIRI